MSLDYFNIKWKYVQLRLNKKVTVTFIVILLLTPISIFLSLFIDHFQWRFDSSYLNITLFMTNEWPWLKFSIVLTLITFLSTYMIYGIIKAHKFHTDITEACIGYILITMPFYTMLFYPGEDSLVGLYDNGALIILMILLYVVHGFGIKIFSENIDDLNNVGTENNVKVGSNCKVK